MTLTIWHLPRATLAHDRFSLLITRNQVATNYGACILRRYILIVTIDPTAVQTYRGRIARLLGELITRRRLEAAELAGFARSLRGNLRGNDDSILRSLRFANNRRDNHERTHIAR